MKASLLAALAAAALARIAADWLTRATIAWSHRQGMLDHANERSSHTQPTPRLGGLGIVGGLLPAIATGIALLHAMPSLWGGAAYIPGLAAIAGGTLAACVLGFIDDRKGMAPIPKLAGQLAIAAGLAWFLAPEALLLEGDPLRIPAWLGIALALGWALLLMNVVNFVDGINGLAGTLGLSAGLALAVGMIPWDGVGMVLGAALCGACWGYLKHNFPVAKTFMGDCGSQAIGAFLAGATLYAASLTRVAPPGSAGPLPAMQVLAPVVLCAVPAYDVLVTLARRARRGEPLLKAHREHLYQRHLAATGGDHARTLEFWQRPVEACAILAALLYFFPGAAWITLIAAVVAPVLIARYHWGVIAAEREALAQ
jgi:UDP-N-acetylmuramyl pentapeptide phosphotransferase/UDP-N-acetylglucosamine-1-phosphate transferase